MAESRELTNSSKSQLYEDDLYSDFDVAGQELNQDLSNTPALAEAVRSSQLGRRVPSTSAVSRQATSARTSTDVLTGPRPPGVFDYSDGQAGLPLTAVHRAGYSSVGGYVSINLVLYEGKYV